MEVREVPLAQIVPPRTLRTGPEGIRNVDELVESIREHGLLQPIRVRSVERDTYQMIAGHRRFLAFQQLGHNTIPAVIVEESEETAAVQGIVENLQREDLTPLELAKGIRELSTSYSLSHDEIAQSLSKSPAVVRTWIRLARLPDDILADLESGADGTQTVSGMTPRNIDPFIKDLPSEEEAQADPSAAELRAERLSTVDRVRTELDRRGARLNAHMSDQVAKRARSGDMTVEEAVSDVLDHEADYRYRRPTTEQIEEETWRAYRNIHTDLNRLARRLRPEIAGSFSSAQRLDLLERVGSVVAILEEYKYALENGAVRKEAHEQPALSTSNS